MIGGGLSLSTFSGGSSKLSAISSSCTSICCSQTERAIDQVQVHCRGF